MYITSFRVMIHLLSPHLTTRLTFPNRFPVCFCPLAVVVVRFSPWVTSSISIQLLQMWNDAPVSYIQESLVSNSVSGFADDKQIAFMLYWNTFSVALIVARSVFTVLPSTLL